MVWEVPFPCHEGGSFRLLMPVLAMVPGSVAALAGPPVAGPWFRWRDFVGVPVSPVLVPAVCPLWPVLPLP
eukprot:4826331-Heterocapsa_arctica.AAC.1